MSTLWSFSIVALLGTNLSHLRFRIAKPIDYQVSIAAHLPK